MRGALKTGRHLRALWTIRIVTRRLDPRSSPGAPAKTLQFRRSEASSKLQIPSSSDQSASPPRWLRGSTALQELLRPGQTLCRCTRLESFRQITCGTHRPVLRPRSSESRFRVSFPLPRAMSHRRRRSWPAGRRTNRTSSRSTPWPDSDAGRRPSHCSGGRTSMKRENQPLRRRPLISLTPASSASLARFLPD
jgi:hypothetical protein